jgi:hypothetical protein
VTLGRSAVSIAVILALLPGAAHAHGEVEGIGPFHGGLLHPVLAPAEALAIVALGLLLGFSGQAAVRAALLPLVLGLSCGLGVLFLLQLDLTPYFPQLDALTYLLRLATIAVWLLPISTLIGAALVAAGLQVPPTVAASLAAITGFAIGADAVPIVHWWRETLIACIGAAVSVTALTLMVAALLIGREQQWQRIGMRIASSWIVASTAMILALEAAI